jgi:predicted RNA-binding Zn ribbon-like protein
MVDDLQLIEDLVNTRFVDAGTDELGSVDELASWLQARHELPKGARLTATDLERVVVVREGLRAVIARNNAGEHAGVDAVPDAVLPGALERLAAVAPELSLVLDVAADPPALVPRPGAGAVDAVLARLLAAVAVAVADGRWKRMKACGQPGCRWAYFDSSRNTSRSWCDMTTCGNRAKARAFRERQR